MPTYTPNYNLAKPLVNDPIDEDLWGGELNDNMDKIDTAIKNASGSTRSTSSSPDTIATTDANNTILVDASGGAFTVNLPAAATVGAGFTVTIKKVDSSANVVTIDANGSETIDGALTFTIGGIYQDVNIICDGSNWSIRQRYIGNVYERLGTDVASAATVDLRQSAITGRKVNITGTTAITAIQIEIGQTRIVKFTGVLTLTYNASSLILPTAANITTAAGDYAEIVGISGGVEVYNYVRASGQPLIPAALTKTFTSTDQTITSGGALTLAHGLGTTPLLFQPYLKNTSSELGYSVGDIIPVNNHVNNDTSNGRGQVITFDATNIYIRFGSFPGQSYMIINKSNGNGGTPIDNTKWSFFIRAWA